MALELEDLGSSSSVTTLSLSLLCEAGFLITALRGPLERAESMGFGVVDWT